MSPSPIQQTSSSDSDPKVDIDSRKRKRMLSNRESARRSRMRKQQHLDNLMKESAELKAENNRIAVQINLLAQQFGCVDAENSVLRAQATELTERLKSLGSVLRFVEEFSGMAMDVPEIPELMLEPWRLPCPAQQQGIMASANGFMF